MLPATATIFLCPGDFGSSCPGSGDTPGVECCCDECDYLLCCTSADWRQHCPGCPETDCPRHPLCPPEPYHP